MFKGDMNKLLRQAQELQREMTRAQDELSKMQLVGEAGGGAVRITLTGDYELVDVSIDPQAIDPEALDMLSELVAAALQDVLDNVKKASEEKMGAFKGMGGGGLF